MTHCSRLLARLSVVTTVAALTTATPAPSQAPGPKADAETGLWSATPSTQVWAEERIFRSGPAQLSGTLYLPRGARIFGAIVVSHGASSPLRSSPLYRHLKEMLPALGIAVFIYDRRGAGKSAGDLSTSDYSLLADDAIAAVRMLKIDPRIDPKRIGVWGLSQGGWLSLLAASRSPEVRFAVSISAPVVAPDVQMIFYSANALAVNGYSQDDIDQMKATRKAVDDYMRGVGDLETAQRMVDAAKAKPWFSLTYMGETVKDRETSRWRKEIEHDPLRTLGAVKVPALVIYGAADPVVPVAASVERLKQLRGRYSELQVNVIAGADHSMQTSVDAKSQMDPKKSDEGAPEAPEYFGLLASWLTQQGIARGH